MGMGSPEQNVEKPSNLNQVFQILNTDAMAGKQMVCRRMGDSLSFYTLFDSDQAAKAANDQLVQLGEKSQLEGRKVLLTAQFPGDEIDKLAETFYSIPKREE